MTQLAKPTEQEIRQMREEIEEAQKEKSRAYHRDYSRAYRVICTPKVGHMDQRLEVQFMGKELFTEEFKMKAVQYVLEGHTQREKSEKFGVSCTPIEKWVNLYKLHGTEGLLSRNLIGRQKGFDSEFRLKVLQYKQEHNLSCTQTAMHFCLDVITVCRWDKKFREKGAQGLMMKQKPNPPAKRQKTQEQVELKKENERLEEENLRLRMENDYLKN